MLSIYRIKDGKLPTNQNDILDEVKTFYTNLYADKQEQSFADRLVPLIIKR